MTKHYEILGVGSLIVDYVVRVNDTFLQEIGGHKGGMELIPYHKFKNTLDRCGGEATKTAGGSSANVIQGMAHLGWSCGLSGKLGQDSEAKDFFDYTTSLGITPLFLHSLTPTARSLCLVTPDGQRTMRTYLGASSEMGPADLRPEDFHGAQLVHVEGYLLHKEGLPERAVALAKAAGALVSFDLASFEMVNQHRKRIISILKDVDIVIANADEGYALTGLPPERCCAFLKDLCTTAVVLFGEGGCWVGKREMLFHGPAIRVDAVDTTGAGDLFTSGFLHGYLQGKPLHVCADYGTLVASTVVQVLGTQIPPLRWKKVLEQIKD